VNASILPDFLQSILEESKCYNVKIVFHVDQSNARKKNKELDKSKMSFIFIQTKMKFSGRSVLCRKFSTEKMQLYAKNYGRIGDYTGRNSKCVLGNQLVFCKEMT